MSQNQFNRETYKKIKKMDRQQMERFVFNIFEEGYQAGLKEEKEAAAGKEIDIEKLKVQIKGIKGVGEKKTEEIITAIKEYLEGSK